MQAKVQTCTGGARMGGRGGRGWGGGSRALQAAQNAHLNGVPYSLPDRSASWPLIAWRHAQHPDSSAFPSPRGSRLRRGAGATGGSGTLRPRRPPRTSCPSGTSPRRRRWAPCCRGAACHAGRRRGCWSWPPQTTGRCRFRCRAAGWGAGRGCRPRPWRRCSTRPPWCRCAPPCSCRCTSARGWQGAGAASRELEAERQRRRHSGAPPPDRPAFPTHLGAEPAGWESGDLVRAADEVGPVAALALGAADLAGARRRRGRAVGRPQ